MTTEPRTSFQRHAGAWLAAVLLAAALAFSPALAEVTAFTGATVHPVSGPAVENGIVLVRDGRIEAVGADLDIPEDARRIELDGMHLYPGFVHPGTALGLVEINSVAGTVDVSEMGNINAAVRAEVAVNHDSMLFPTSIAGGVLSAHVMPSGGLIRGTSAVMSLDGWSWEEMVLASPVGMHMAFPSAVVDEDESEDLTIIERVLDQARHYHQAVAAAEAGNGRRPLRNDQLEALGPLLAGEQALFLHASRYDAMINALDWAEDQGFDRVVLVGNADAQYLAERLASDGTPLILRGIFAMPSRRWEPYDMTFTAAARLHEAGVQFAISDSGGGLEVANARNLPFQAGTAAAHGLPREAALRSVTLAPAEILGVADQLGSIEPGKRASFFAATGDPLEPMTRIERVWIDGEEFDLGRDRSRQLYERYRERNARAQGREP